jgi:hypothetical protein
VDNLQIAWFTDLSDTEKTMSSFYRYCTDAEHPSGFLASPDGKTDSVHVKQRTLAIIENIRDDPVAVIGLHPKVITAHGQ